MDGDCLLRKHRNAKNGAVRTWVMAYARVKNGEVRHSDIDAGRVLVPQPIFPPLSARRQIVT